MLGHGVGGFPREFNRYSVEYDYETRCHPHNDSLLVWVQSGIVGLAAFWAVWAVFFRLAGRAIRKMVRHPDPERHWMIRAGLWGVIAILIAGFFQCYYIDAEVSVVFWVLLAISAKLAVDVTDVVGDSDKDVTIS